MFGSKKKQYVVITKQDKQLKLNYKILQNDKIFKEEHSSFLITNQSMPQDALLKLDALQKDIPYTYLGALFEGANQKVIKNDEIDVISYESIKFTDSMSIVIPKNELVSTSRYYINSGIDYLFSPFSILHEYLQDLGVKNSLNVFVLNSKVYTILLGAYKEVIRADVKELTPYEEIKDEDFSDDEILDQKLYEEVYFLEIQQFLNDIVQEYYASGDDVDFLEEIKVLYTLEPFSKEQINSLYETLMVNVNYEQIDLQYYLSNMMTSENARAQSFIDSRVKKEQSNPMGWVFLIILSLIAVSLVIYFNMSEPPLKTQKSNEISMKKIEEPAEVKKELEKIKTVILPKFPDHITINNNLQQRISMLFDIVPYDGILKDIEVTKDNATYVVNFAMPSNSIEDMQTKLKNIYTESNVLLKHQNKALLNVILENNNITTKENEVTLKEYPKLNFMPVAKATDYIKAILFENSSIKFDTKEYQLYKFNVVAKIQSPEEFFKFLAKINKQKNAIAMDYPVMFSRLNDAIEVKFNLNLCQEIQPLPQPKK